MVRIKERIQLMCALRAHIKLSIFRNIFSGIDSFFNSRENFFQKWKLLCALRAHISKILKELQKNWREYKLGLGTLTILFKKMKYTIVPF